MNVYCNIIILLVNYEDKPLTSTNNNMKQPAFDKLLYTNGTSAKNNV